MENFGAFIPIIISFAIAWYAWKKYKSHGSVRPVNEIGGTDYGRSGRECLVCGYKGKMKTWLGNYWAPQFVALLGLLFFFIPGLIFIALFWGKYKCTNCGALGKNQGIGRITHIKQQEGYSDSKKCPYCAETIKAEAIICRYCQRDLCDF